MGAQRIPIAAARRIAEAYGQQQVILVTWDGGTTHVVTYGTTLEHCRQAAQGGNVVKRALGWPDEACHAEPARARRTRQQATPPTDWQPIATLPRTRRVVWLGAWRPMANGDHAWCRARCRRTALLGWRCTELGLRFLEPTHWCANMPASLVPDAPRLAAVLLEAADL